MYADYKGGRSKTPGEFIEQMPYFNVLLDAWGIPHYRLNQYEADDIIGTLAKQGEAAGYEVVVLSGDKDLIQLADNNITVKITTKGVTEDVYKRQPFGELHFKTDNRGLFEYSLASFSQFGLVLKQVWLDLHQVDFPGNVMTEYEEKFSAKGHPIYRVEVIFPQDRKAFKQPE